MVGYENYNDELNRQTKTPWEIEFETPEQYVEAKLVMLRQDMYIEPTEEEIAHLHELKTVGDIDRAVHSIIDRAWS